MGLFEKIKCSRALRKGGYCLEVMIEEPSNRTDESFNAYLTAIRLFHEKINLVDNNERVLKQLSRAELIEMLGYLPEIKNTTLRLGYGDFIDRTSVLLNIRDCLNKGIIKSYPQLNTEHPKFEIYFKPDKNGGFKLRIRDYHAYMDSKIKRLVKEGFKRKYPNGFLSLIKF